MNEDVKRALYLAGIMADAAIAVTGGIGLNFKVKIPDIYTIGDKALTLRFAINEYNEHIIKMTEKNRNNKNENKTN